MYRGLTPKQEKFVQELIKGKSQREAYRAAYNASNMANTTIDSNACRLFKKDKIRARYDELRFKIVKRAEEKAIITAEEVLREIANIAMDGISNYLDFRTEKTIAGYQDGEIIFDYKNIVEIKDSRKIDTKNIAEIQLGKDGQLKFKTYRRDTALYKLAEIMGMNEILKAKQKLAEQRFQHEQEIDKKKHW